MLHERSELTLTYYSCNTTGTPMGPTPSEASLPPPEGPRKTRFARLEARDWGRIGLGLGFPSHALDPSPALSPPAPEVDRPPPPEVGRGQLTPAGTAGGAPAAWVPGHCDPRTAPPEEPWGQLAPKDPWGSQTTVVM